MKNFAALSTVIAKVDPSSTSSSAYTPTNSPQACPDVNDTWNVTGASLPPTPDAELCACMYQSATCVPADNLKTDNYGDIFGYICGLSGNLCAGISGAPDTGVYGAFIMCNSTQKLAYVLDAYYKSVSQVSACDFDGQAVTQKSSIPDSCSAGLASASVINSVAATATAPIATSDITLDNADSFGLPSAQVARLFTVGDLAIGAYLGVAFIAGIGMVML